jgi:hypothetical protein
MVITTDGSTNGRYAPRPLRRWLTLFEIANRRDLALDYRLVDVQGLPPGEHYDKNLNQLVKAVAFALKQPVALVRRGDRHALAIPATATLSMTEVALTPHVARLLPSDETSELDLAHLDETTAPIATRFLTYAFRTPLMRDQALWSAGTASLSKRPLNDNDRRASVDLYPGFVWNVVSAEEGRLFLALDTTIRYVERAWFIDRLDGGDVAAYRARHFLYQFGHQWFKIQLWGVTNQSIAEQRFVPDGAAATDVFTYTQERWKANPPHWVRDLDPDSPAIIYRYPGKDLDRYGALALCKLALSTSDAEAAGLHQRSILSPAERLYRVQDVVARHFQEARLGNQAIRVSVQPLEVERRVFPVPPQRFGHDRILAVAPRLPAVRADVVSLDDLGQRRLRLLRDPRVGPLDTSPFDPQYLLLPRSAPRAINEDFADRYERAMREVSGQEGYTARRILYDDRQASSLQQQVQAIQRAVDEGGASRGYGLLVLPEQARPGLHNYIKRKLWPHLQFQCAMLAKIREHYEPAGPETVFQPKPAMVGRLASYVRNCALGMLVVNRKWSWALAAPLHYDVYVGVDVLNGIAGVTFVYGQGAQIFFRDYPCQQKERLSAAQLRDILVKHLRDDLTALGLYPRSLVVHRDGRSFTSELKGFRLAMRQLKVENILPIDAVTGVVDIHKTSADHLRMVEGESPETISNPTIGGWHTLGSHEGIVCTTGQPFRFPGTAKPLTAVIREGALDIVWVLEDIYDLSHLIFTAPDKCGRLPITIKLADAFLEPIAAGTDDEAALYDDLSDLDDVLDDDELAARQTAGQVR